MYPLRTDDGRVLTTVSELRSWLMDATENDPGVRRDMAKIFQRANRRIQNLQASMDAQRIGYSPALQAVLQYTGDAGGRFSKFHMVKNWDMMLEQTAQALAFMNEPTSTASGARKWQREMTKGITDRFGDELSESDVSRMMRAVYDDDMYGDEQFRQIAQRYLLSRTEIQVQQSRDSMQSFVNDYVSDVERRKLQEVNRAANEINDSVNMFVDSLMDMIGNAFRPIR